MRRDIGNEVIVAIAAVGVIAFAVIFGIVLTISNGDQGAAATTVPLATRQPTVLFTLPPTEVTPATDSPAATVVAQNPTAILPATVVASATVFVPLNPTAAPTLTLSPTNTDAPPTVASTALLPANTTPVPPTTAPSVTPNPTNTDTVEPSATATETATVEPSATPTETATLEPSATA